jgi:hypothetical protein
MNQFSKWQQGIYRNLPLTFDTPTLVPKTTLEILKPVGPIPSIFHFLRINPAPPPDAFG